MSIHSGEEARCWRQRQRLLQLPLSQVAALVPAVTGHRPGVSAWHARDSVRILLAHRTNLAILSDNANVLPAESAGIFDQCRDIDVDWGAAQQPIDAGDQRGSGECRCHICRNQAGHASSCEHGGTSCCRQLTPVRVELFEGQVDTQQHRCVGIHVTDSKLEL
eukprot:835282-Prymnesium_polylepis.2